MEAMERDARNRVASVLRFPVLQVMAKAVPTVGSRTATPGTDACAPNSGTAHTTTPSPSIVNMPAMVFDSGASPGTSTAHKPPTANSQACIGIR